MIKKPPGTYRFFYHYHRHKDKMTFHFKKQCVVIDDVICKVPCETKWNKTQPYLIMRGFCKSFKLEDNKVIIE